MSSATGGDVGLRPPIRVRELHEWEVTTQRAQEIQRQLAGRVSRSNEIGPVRLVAGADVSSPRRKEGLARGAVVVLSYPELEVVEVSQIEQRITFPYVPGLLSFREAPAVLAAYERLRHEPDLMLVDGQGLAHPRRFGLACHLGLLWDRPTIGCAKSLLCGSHEALGSERGKWAPIRDHGEVVGAAVRTRGGVAPVYVSTGHKVDLESAVLWVLRCCRGLRLPEPIRQAHMAAGRLGKTEQTTPAAKKAALPLLSSQEEQWKI